MTLSPDELPGNQPERHRKPLEKFRKNFTGLSPSQRCLTPGDLPPWARTGIGRKVMSGKKWKQVAAEMDVVAADLYRYYHTPGGKLWAESVEEQRKGMDDPVQIARLGAMLEAPYWQQEMMVLYLAAKMAGDLAEMGRLGRFMMTATGAAQPENKANTPLNITVNVQQQTFTVEAPMGDSSHSKVVDAEIIEDG